MSEWHSVDFAQQGWQCPVCKRVYSPFTTMCYYCGNEKQQTTTTVKTNFDHDLTSTPAGKEYASVNISNNYGGEKDGCI